MIKYSVVVPVYNRPNETKELLESLTKQDYTNFEVIIIEDGSSERSDMVVDHFKDQLNITYHLKPNTGPGHSRNIGMELAKGEFIILFDSDCIIPKQYFSEVEKFLSFNKVDVFGGPDAAHESFSKIQKAINHVMTSIITTGGIRGKENRLDNYQPRSFNMGISKKAYETVGGFSDIHPGEDPDLSYRFMNAGFKIGLIQGAYVYHKRRIDFSKFAKQVYKFGIVRPILIKWHPSKFKPTYLFPTIFLLGSIHLILLSIFVNPMFDGPIALFALLIFLECLVTTKSLSISILAILAGFIQMYWYGYGFLKSSFYILILKKNERKVFPGFFFDEKN